ncbi:MAG: hypothetical protein V2A73_01715 [Pseudomonadota bacterium]
MNRREQLFAEVSGVIQGGPTAVLQAAAGNDEPDLGLLVLWIRHAEERDVESGRVLAIEAGKRPETGVGKACRRSTT